MYFQTIPHVKYLFYLLDKLPRRGVCRLRANIIAKTEQYFRGTDTREHFVDLESTDIYTVATLLDPRFRKSGFSSQTKADNAEQILIEKVAGVDLAQGQTDLDGSVESTHSNIDGDDWDICMNTDSNDPEITFTGEPSGIRTAQNEVSTYMTEKNIGKDKSPFTWWAANGEKYPRLTELAKCYLSAPMSSIASEREFKIAKRVTTGRWNLKPDNVQKLLFLKYNLRLLGYKY